jgi:hypothetical protein
MFWERVAKSVQIVLLLQGHGGNNRTDEVLMRCMTWLPQIYIHTPLMLNQ